MRASKRGQLALPRRSPCRAERGATGVGRWLVGCAGSWPVERAPLRVETVQADLRGKYALLRRVYGPRGVSLREFSANQPLSSAFFVSLGQTRCHRRRFNTLRYRWRGLVAEHYSEASDGQSPSGHPKDSILRDPSLSRRISLKRATKATRKIWSSGTRYPGTLDAARHAEGSSDVQMIWLTMLHPSGQSAAQNGFLGPEKRHQWASTCYASSARSLTGPASPSRCQTRRRGGDRKTIIWNGSPHTAPATNKTAQAGGQPPLPPKNQITHHASVPERSGAGTYPKRLHSRGAIRWKRLVDNACRAGPSSERQPLARDRSRRERRCRSGSGGGPTTLYTLLRRHCEAPSAHEAERQDGYRGTLEEWPSARRSAAVRARPSAPRWECANETSRTGAQSLSTEALAGSKLVPISSSLLSGSDAGHSYLVDPASSHMLVSKIKPCMSKYILLHSETANGSLNQLWFLRSYNPTWITVAILELIHATQLRPPGKSAFVSTRPTRVRPAAW